MYAVVDTETTGKLPSWHDRIVEVAVVLVDGHGHVEREWVTLLNPDRDLGPQRIHGIRAAEILEAPSFDDIAGYLLTLLAGRTLVAHNLPFDLMFLKAEYDRLGVCLPLSHDLGLCTMKLSSAFLPGAGRSLRECCSAAKIPLTGWHSALSDAKAAAALLGHYIAAAPRPLPWSDTVYRGQNIRWPKLSQHTFHAVTRRGSKATASADGPGSFVGGLLDYMPRADSSDLADPYLAVLDQTLADRYLSADESAVLAALATTLGIGASEVERLHRDYLDALARIALADHHLTGTEAADLARVADILDLPENAIDTALETAKTGARLIAADELPLKPGDMVVFTGDMGEPRELWMQRATEHGFTPHGGVTKAVRLVVAADPDTLSGKAKKARGYGIPIMSIDEFRAALGYPPPADHSTAHRTQGESSLANSLQGS